MSFKIGDTVSVLDDTIFGNVTQIEGSIITIETKDGFEFNFEANKLIIDHSESTLKYSLFSKQSSESVIIEKEQQKKFKVVKPKDRNLPTMEVDLHIHQLTNSSKRMTNYEMLNLQLETAKRQLEFAIQKRIQKLVFVHGVGEGILKLELETLFGRYNNIKFYDADYKKYGVGATEIYIFQNRND
jgi:hypothetical protein